MKVNIVGSGPGWEKAPRDEDEVSWGFYTSAEMRGDFDIVFDMHPIPDILTGKRLKEGRTNRSIDSCKKMLRRAPANGYTIYSLEAYDGCEKYPIKDIVKKFNTSFFTCGFDYMMALAIYRGFTEIDVYGVTLFRSEYKFEREGISYWIGRAEGSGIKVTVHGPTSLMRIPARKIRGRDFDACVYGYEVPEETFIENVLTDNLVHHKPSDEPQQVVAN